MRRFQFAWGVCLGAVIFFSTLPSRAVIIDIQYPTGTLFAPSLDATAKAAINAAAADISAAITSTLNAVPSDVFVGTSNQTTATFDWNADYLHPVTGGTLEVSEPTLASNTVTIFLDTANLAGSSQGIGGPSIGFAFSGGSSGGNIAQDWPAATTNAATQSQVAYRRGGGPVMGNFSGSSTLGDAVANYSIDYGVAFGNIWLDVDTNNNGAKDSTAVLQNYWQFDHTTTVAPGKSDLYSTALHEILHVLGIGPADSWDELIAADGTTWQGSEVTEITGSGANLIDPAGGHIASSTMSTRLSDGSPQEVVMDPTLTFGTRKELTALDLAFLRDIGYDTIVPTIPGDYDGDGDVDNDDLATWEASMGVNSNGDADGDGDTDGRDFLVWQQNYTGPSSFSAPVTVPEPNTLALWAMAMTFCLKWRFASFSHFARQHAL